MAGKKKSGTPSEKKARAARPPKAPKKRVAGLPAAGSVIKREYGGKTHEVRVNQEDFTYNGDRYSSLTSVALKITGYKAISGPVFFKKALAARASDEA